MGKLNQTLPLGGFKREWPGFELTEYYMGECVSLAIAAGQEEAFFANFKSAYGKVPPPPSTVVQIKGGWAFWAGQGQYMLLMVGENINADLDIAAIFGETAYVTLQTDAWVSLDITSERAHDVLERFMALDLRSAPNYFAARTSAHHIAVIVIKFDDDKYHLMTPRSSAHAFTESLVHVINNVVDT